MEKTLLVLEDNEKTADIIEKIALNLLSKVKVIKETSINGAYKIALEKEIDIFIIDIILNTKIPGDISGIMYAQNIRKISRYQFTPIIFVTALADPELYAYRDIHCFGYIEKPFEEKQIITLLNQSLNYSTNKEKDKIIYLRKDGILYSIHLAEVIYIQVQFHKMKLFLTNQIIDIPYKTIKSFMEEADYDDLVQCNRYTIINRQYILNIDFSNRYIKLKGIHKPIEIGIVYKKMLMKYLNVF